VADGGHAAGPAGGSKRAGTVGVVVLSNLAADARLRAFGHLAFGWYRLQGTPGLTFAKVLGSGRDGGFRPSPSATHQGLFLAFASEATANAFLARRSGLLDSLASNAREFLTAKLHAYASRGQWSGRSPLLITAPRPAPDIGPIASLTRASIRPSKAIEFWRHAPASQDSLHASDGCLVAAGLGEMPLLRQATFTVWESETAMERFSRQGAHLAAIRNAMANGHFSESLFARFTVSDLRGTWHGRRFDGATAVDTNRRPIAS